MKTFKNKLEIRREDFVNLVNGYPVELPMVTDINDTKIEEVQGIYYNFETKEESNIIAGKTSKSYLGKLQTKALRPETDKAMYNCVSFYFNLYFTTIVREK
jgi:hypothetical protein